MIKTYKLTQPLRNNSFVLRGKTGNAMRYNFAGGDPLTGKAATLILKTQYAQDLLEESEMFQKGYVRLVKEDEGGEKVRKAPESSVIENVTSPEQLLEFVATNLEKTYRRPESALEFAKKQGFTFPNLNL